MSNQPKLAEAPQTKTHGIFKTTSLVGNALPKDPYLPVRITCIACRESWKGTTASLKNSACPNGCSNISSSPAHLQRRQLARLETFSKQATAVLQEIGVGLIGGWQGVTNVNTFYCLPHPAHKWQELGRNQLNANLGCPICKPRKSRRVASSLKILSEDKRA